MVAVTLPLSSLLSAALAQQREEPRSFARVLLFLPLFESLVLFRFPLLDSQKLPFPSVKIKLGFLLPFTKKSSVKLSTLHISI